MVQLVKKTFSLGADPRFTPLGFPYANNMNLL